MVHVVHSYQRVPAELVRRFQGVSIATIHEAQGKRGAMAAAIKPIYSGMRVCGSALTVKCQAGDNLMLHKAIDMVADGQVIVCDIGGWEGGPWGEMMSVAAKARGCAGLVIDSCVRDGAAIRDLGFSVFARGLSVIGTYKEDLGLVNHPISCAGVIVQPGDLVVGDDDGVCVVRAEEAEEVLERAKARDEEESQARKLLATGQTPWLISGFAEVARAKGLTDETEARLVTQ